MASYQWSTVASPEYQNLPFPATVTAKDANGYTVTGFNGRYTLGGWVGGGSVATPPPGTPIGTGNTQLLGTNLQLGVNADGSLIVQGE